MFLKKYLGNPALYLTVILFLCMVIPTAIGQETNSAWEDSATGLTWTVKDNGEDVGWNQAAGYCTNLDVDGKSDWRLPTIDELKTIFDRSQDKRYKAKGPIELEAASIWSSSRNNSGDVWSLNFSYGGKSLSPTGGCGSAGRALCVRGTQK